MEGPPIPLRRERQYPTYPASVVCDGLVIEGLLRNLSNGGALFEGHHQLEPGTRVALNIGGLGRIAASVAWSIGERAGLRFEEKRP